MNNEFTRSVLCQSYMRTRLASNLRPTTRECVHLVTRGHFGHVAVHFAASKTSRCTQTLWLFFIEAELLPIKFYIAGIWIFNIFCSCDLALDPMTFIYAPDPYSLEINRIYNYEPPAWRLSKVIVWQTDRQTDRHDLNYIPRRFAGYQ